MTSVARTCSHAGCEKPFRAKGYCGGHYYRWTKGHDMNAPFKGRREVTNCKIPKCNRKSRSQGLCNGHYQRHLKGGDMSIPLREVDRSTWVCSVDWCDRARKSHRYCSMHHQRHLKGSDMNAKPKTSKFVGSCSVDKCERPHDARGVCQRHYQQVVKYNVTVEWISQRYLKGCEICGKDGVLHIDHDHSCCPQDKGTCGKCNRAMLCWSCNAGLGQFRDNIENLEKAVEYLKLWESRKNVLE